MIERYETARQKLKLDEIAANKRFKGDRNQAILQFEADLQARRAVSESRITRQTSFRDSEREGNSRDSSPGENLGRSKIMQKLVSKSLERENRYYISFSWLIFE